MENEEYWKREDDIGTLYNKEEVLFKE